MMNEDGGVSSQEMVSSPLGVQTFSSEAVEAVVVQ